MIATMNPSPSAIEETKSTLKVSAGHETSSFSALILRIPSQFATRIKKVVLKAMVNEVVDDKALIHKYRFEIARLQAQLEAQASVPNTPSITDSHSEQQKVRLLPVLSSGDC